MDKLQVFKIGGKVIDNEPQLDLFLESFSKIKGKKLLVHGGGKLATNLAERMNVATKMLDGRRVTDDQMIEIVTMTYGGLINKKIVAKLQHLGLNAIGLTGADLNLIQSNIRKNTSGLDWGWVGDPETLNAQAFNELINQSKVPVIAPLTHDMQGHLLNTNADTIANKIAEALSSLYEVDLNFTFDLKGVMKDINDPNSLIEELRVDDYKKYKSEGVINQGMIPKLDNAFEAISKGVSSVRIINYAEIDKIESNDGGYTRIY